MNKKVIIAMSGGIDSSVAAYILRQKGMTVEGVFFILFDEPENLELAKKTAEFLKINFHIVDLRETFKIEVIKTFFEGYKKGITPNPCVICNKRIKFPALVEIAKNFNARYIATGHYARIVNRDINPMLLKGIDIKKDQSYFLYGIERSLLDKILFPLGDYTKEAVKAIAEEAHIPSRIAKASTEVCFLKNKRYYDFIKPAKQGPIIDISNGKIIGQHRGIYLYTIGQRKRLGIASPYPLYVIKIDTANNIVFVGPKQKAYMREITVRELNWLLEIAGIELSCEVKIRYAMSPEKANLKIMDKDTIKICFEKPQFAPTPGQSAVFYKDDIVLGGGVITETEQGF